MSKTKSRSLDLAVQDKVCAYLGLANLRITSVVIKLGPQNHPSKPAASRQLLNKDAKNAALVTYWRG